MSNAAASGLPSLAQDYAMLTLLALDASRSASKVGATDCAHEKT